MQIKNKYINQCLGGCTTKMESSRLARILARLDPKQVNDDNLLVDYKTNDDCAVYRLNESYLCESLDFFPMIGDDYYKYGQIVAANALSDIYAMGAKPLYALNMLSIPKDLGDEEIEEIVSGMHIVLNEDNVSIAGGHTINGDQLLCGLSVMGMMKKLPVQNNTPQINDVIVLTKPLGVGICLAAMVADGLLETTKSKMYQWTTLINKAASEIACNNNVHAMTDVTGFGLAGHLKEMMGNNKFDFLIEKNNLPLIDNEIKKLIADFYLTGGGQNNRNSYARYINNLDALPLWTQEIIFDPQTSGGLLLCFNQSDYDNFAKSCAKQNVFQAVIGTAIKKKDDFSKIRVQ